MAFRAAKPKLSLALPTSSCVAATPKSPFARPPMSPSAISSPTARNTALNQRGLSTLQAPTFAYAKPSETRSILKRNQSGRPSSKKIHFKENPTVTCISPMPEDYHGQYVKMSRDERRWGKAE